jgi:hypothetical protein
VLGRPLPDRSRLSAPGARVPDLPLSEQRHLFSARLLSVHQPLPRDRFEGLRFFFLVLLILPPCPPHLFRNHDRHQISSEQHSATLGCSVHPEKARQTLQDRTKPCYGKKTKTEPDCWSRPEILQQARRLIIVPDIIHEGSARLSILARGHSGSRRTLQRAFTPASVDRQRRQRMFRINIRQPSNPSRSSPVGPTCNCENVLIYGC